MNQKTKNILTTLFALALIAAGGFLIYIFSTQVLSRIDKINPNVLVALIAGTVTIIGYFITRYLERKKLIEQQIREQKVPTYEEFIDFIFKIFKSSKTNTPLNDKELQDLYWNLNKKAILWLSDKTLKSYTHFRDSSANHANLEKRTQLDNAIVLLAFEQLLLDFRSDIGHDNKNLESGDLLSLFINDMNELKDMKR
ncbi:hypothetical protein [Ekhidna sp.]|uniref:hypothetical protein n=1 Tax=Ekhidna sp. TaxID=2608089 RepID=UPI00329A112F